MPFIGTVPSTRIHYALGYSGHGVGPSWLAGRVLASLVTGLDDEWARLPLVDRSVARVPREPVRRIGGGAIRAAILSLEEAEEHGRRASPAARAVAAVPRLLGMKLGSASGTHFAIGRQVRWRNAQKSDRTAPCP